MTAIKINNLSKSYGPVGALREVSAEIMAGQITGLVGPNGAGKTTLIKAVVGALQPNSGSLHVLGHNPIADRWALRQRLGYMPQEPALYDDLSALDNVAFYARVHGVKESRQRATTLLTELDLAERLRSPVHTLSGGMQKRVSLACALVHEPELFILDEPTAALDPVLKRHLWERFRQMAARGATLLVSTHQMDEAILCDSIVVLQHGRVVAHDQPARLLQHGLSKVTITRRGQVLVDRIPATGLALAAALKSHRLLRDDVDSVSLEPESLEDVMVKLIRDQKL